MKVIEELAALQESFFKKTGDLYECKEHLGGLYEIMLKDIISAYEKASKQLMRKAKIEYETASYELDCKEDELLPGRCGFFWLNRNKAADIIYREVAAQAMQEFKKRTEALEKLEAALRTAEDKGRADDEPEEPKATLKQLESAQNKEKVQKPKKPEQLPGQITLDDVQNVQGGKPDTATNTTLSAEKKKAVKPQTRTENRKASEQNQKEEKISTG